MLVVQTTTVRRGGPNRRGIRLRRGGVIGIVVGILVAISIAAVIALVVGSSGNAPGVETTTTTIGFSGVAAPSAKAWPSAANAGPSAGPAALQMTRRGDAAACSSCATGRKNTAPEPRWWGGEATCPSSASFRSKDDGDFHCDVCFTTDQVTANLFKRGGGAAVGVVEATSPNPDLPVMYFLVDREPQCMGTLPTNAKLKYIPEGCACQRADQAAFPHIIGGDYDT